MGDKGSQPKAGVKRLRAPRWVVVTGTDTGVGKTWLTALVTSALRAEGVNVAALKPFATGTRGDARVLRAAQGRGLTLRQINPFFWRHAVAPLVAMRRTGRSVSAEECLGAVRQAGASRDLVLVEGCGGLLAPLGPGFDLRDLARSVGAHVLVVAANRVGVLNHTLLTLQILAMERLPCLGVALIDPGVSDESAHTNPLFLRELGGEIPVWRVPRVQGPLSLPVRLRAGILKLRKTAAGLIRALQCHCGWEMVKGKAR